MSDNNKTCIKEHGTFMPETLANATWKDGKGMKGWEGKYSWYPPPPSPLVDFCLERGGGCQKGGVSLEMGRKTEYSTLISIMVLMERVSFLRGVE